MQRWDAQEEMSEFRAELRGFQEYQVRLQRQLEEWMVRQGNATAEMLAKQELMRLIAHSRSTNMDQFSSLRVLRITKVIRVFRVLRAFRNFHELRIMIHSILQSFKSLIWVLLVMAMMFYMFSLSFTQAVIDHLASRISWQSSEVDHMFRYFGTLDRSILSLFQAMSGGLNWADLLDALGPLHSAYTVLFLLYIAISVFAIVNIVTGIFVDKALQSSQADRDLLTQEEMYAKEKYVQRMLQLFKEMDNDGDGTIALAEFEAALEDERMVYYFNALGLEISDVTSLFRLLDRDRKGFIDPEAFVNGCMRLKGGARSLDMARLMYESEWVVHSMETLARSVDAIRDMLSIHDRADSAEAFHDTLNIYDRADRSESFII